MLAATDQLVVATGIANIWAWDPAALHAEATAVERAYPGRFLLGLGVSHRPQVEQLGREYRRPLAAMEAFLDDLDRVQGDRVQGDRAQGGGEGGEGDGKRAAPPRVLAALGPRMLALARARSAGAHPYLVTPDHTAMARRTLGEGPLLAPELAVVVRSDGSAARGIAREYLATYLRLPNYLSNLRRLGFGDDDFADGGNDRLVDALVPSGSTKTVAARVREHFDAGADHVCVQPLAEARQADLDGFTTLLDAIGP